jgi:hypothetical protein
LPPTSRYLTGKGAGPYREVFEQSRTSSTVIKIGNDDPTLTGHAGLLLSDELVCRLEVVETIDGAVSQVRPFKQRQRGLNASHLMVSLAETIIVGGDHMVHLDELGGDLAGRAAGRGNAAAVDHRGPIAEAAEGRAVPGGGGRDG